jgi:hypothetical protein
MIKIYFLPEAPALQYVIHNAGDNIHATIYLKREQEQEYFEWESGAGAYRLSVLARSEKSAGRAYSAAAKGNVLLRAGI